MYGVHVVDECLHSLVYTGNGLIDCMLDNTFFSFKVCQWTDDIVIQLNMIKVLVVIGIQFLAPLVGKMI